MTTLKEVNFGTENKYCVPSAISAITGLSTDEVAEIIQKNRKNSRAVRAVYYCEAIDVLNELGYRAIIIPLSCNNSLFFTLMNCQFENGLYFFGLQGHVIVLEKNFTSWYLVDNVSKKPLNVGMSARLGQKVLLIFKIEKV